MRNVYLCSRVAPDARPLNAVVAASLRSAGFTAYIPHETAPNNPTDQRYDKKEIWKYDFDAMNRSDICVVVGRTGKDCAFEIGWFFAQNVPIYFVPNGDRTWLDSPMLIEALTQTPHIEQPAKAGEKIRSHLSKEEI